MRAFALAASLVLLVPTSANADEPAREMRSAPMFVGGIVLAAVGGAGITGGGVLLFLGATIKQAEPQIKCSTGAPCPVFHQEPPPAVVAGGVILAAGAIATAISIPMIVVGAKRVPLDMSPSGPDGSAGVTLRLTF